MKKNFTLLLFFLLSTCITFSQSIFHENFENPDSVVSSGNPGWVLSNAAQTSGLFSDSGGVALGDSSFLTTIPFSTVGAYHVILKFNHIFTSYNAAGILEVSTNGGSTWTMLTSNQYLGNANYFTQGSSFHNFCYSNWGIPGIPFCYSAANSMWHSETFDLSTLCANQANVMLRFKMKDYPNSTSTCGGWFIDDLNMAGFPYSITSAISCYNDGTATLTPYFGTAPHTYQWNTAPVQTDSIATGLTNGMYSCTVTDALGTSFTDSVEVKSAIQVQSGVQHPTCGMNDGSISVYVTSANPPLNYMWSNGSIGNPITNLSPGVYTITITDGIGCVRTETFNLDCGFNSNSLTLTSTPSACNNPTGTATVQSFLNSVPPLTYSWNTLPVQITQTATGLAGGQYYMVWVKDANNDSAQAGIFVPYNDTILASAIYTPTQCDSATGTATGNGINGVAPYTYVWNTLPVQTTQTATGLGNTSYTVTVTDANGCMDNATLNIPNNVTMSAYINYTATTCGMSTGSAWAVVMGGTPPFTYLWSNNQTTDTITGLADENYTVTITDSNGCSLQKWKHVNSVSNLVVNVSYSSASCNCVPATVSVTGGAAPYAFWWDNGQTTVTNTCAVLGWNYVIVTDANGCTVYENFYVNYPANCFIDVQGYVFSDNNHNCIKDVGEYGIANVPLGLVSPNYAYSTHTDNIGHYAFHALSDVYALTQFVPQYWTQLCPAQNPDTINVPAGTIVNHDIADTADYFFDNVEIYSCYSSSNTRGFPNHHYIHVKNLGTTMLFGNLIAHHDPVEAFSLATPPATYNLPTTTVNWTYANLIPGEDRSFSFRTNISAATPLGTLLLDSTYVTPLVTDVNTANNYCDYTATVNGSYDPNNKVAVPEGTMQKDSLWHFYTIHFQNTGTATAIRVIVEDTLDSHFDFSTLTDINASHSFVLDTSALPVVKFIFDNINLVDSGSYEAGSHGNVSFRIKHLPGLTAGTVIHNTAYIYFDFNSPIVTNTTVNMLVNSVGLISATNQNNFIVFPNPANSTINIKCNLLNQPFALLELFDNVGRKVRSVLIKRENVITPVDVRNLSSGFYFYKITGDKEISSGKISILR